MPSAMAKVGTIRVGISGWRYKGWRGKFYPSSLTQARELEFASRQFSTIELNGSFYSLQRPESFERWRAETPEDFVFAVKGSRYITHMLRTKNIDTPLANFFAQGLLKLGPKLGPILWQFPPRFRFDPDTLQAFLEKLPRTQKEAAKLALRHDDRLNGRAWLEAEANLPVRHAVEIRDESFACEGFVSLLRKQKVGLVVADTVEWPLLLDVTADFVYCRLHGSEQLYASGYGRKAIDTWAQRAAAWSMGKDALDGRRASDRPAPARHSRDVFVYFDNDMKVRAPVDAKALERRIGALPV